MGHFEREKIVSFLALSFKWVAENRPILAVFSRIVYSRLDLVLTEGWPGWIWARGHQNRG